MAAPYFDGFAGTGDSGGGRGLDHVLFWNGLDLERKLADFQTYYNAAREFRATLRLC